MAALVLGYFAAFGTTAWQPTDYEYVMACAYRIAHGELPYRDFIYHKPPATIFLHVPWLWLPGGTGVLASRLFFYFQMVASGFLPALWALHRGRVAFGWRLPVLAALGSVIALHNFPVMPWQTSDGVFFVVLGLVAWLESFVATASPRRAIAMRAAASLSLTVGFLAKQSFFGNCLLFGVVSGGELAFRLYRHRREGLRLALALFLASAVPAAACLGGLVLWARASGVWEHYLAQLVSQSTPEALRYHLLLYSRSSFRWTLWLWAALPVMRWIAEGSRGWRAWPPRLLAGVGLVLFARAVQQHVGDKMGALGELTFYLLLGTLLGRAFVVAGRVVLRKATPTDGLMLLLHVGFFVTAWMCLLSLGYPSPLLGAAGLGLALHEVLPEEQSWVLDVGPVVVATALVMSAFFSLNWGEPYRDAPRGTLTWNLGDLFPSLRGIRTNEGTYRRYAELKSLVQRYAVEKGRLFVVTQDYPGAHWLLEAKNPWAIDWAYPPEPDGFERRLFEDLQRNRPIALVPKMANAPFYGIAPFTSCDRVDYRWHNVFSQVIVQRWPYLGEGNDFCVFGLP